MNDRIGQQLGNYRLLYRLGSGGFAEVYLGEHIYLKRRAAIKVLPMRLTSEEMESFSEEAGTIAAILFLLDEKVFLPRYMILDNDEDFTLLQALAPSNVHGHILLTTRTQTTGSMAQRVDLCSMARDEAILFLLRRVKKLSQEVQLTDARTADRKKANEIATLLGDHPLALDQAGAYIEETGCSLDDYLCRYSTSRAKLLAMRGGLGVDHPASVTATFVHSFIVGAFPSRIWE